MKAQQLPADWRSGDRRTLAVIRPEIHELSEALGIEWRRAWDDLDYFDFAVLVSASGKVFALRRYVGMPTPGTEIVVDLDLSRQECSLDEALEVLGLTRADVTWTGPPAGAK
jgi:hypothetical protein